MANVKRSDKPTLCIIGESMVGKSSLVNVLIGKHVARVYSTTATQRTPAVYTDCRPMASWICAKLQHAGSKIDDCIEVSDISYYSVVIDLSGADMNLINNVIKIVDVIWFVTSPERPLQGASGPGMTESQLFQHVKQCVTTTVENFGKWQSLQVLVNKYDSADDEIESAVDTVRGVADPYGIFMVSSHRLFRALNHGFGELVPDNLSALENSTINPNVWIKREQLKIAAADSTLQSDEQTLRVCMAEHGRLMQKTKSALAIAVANLGKPVNLTNLLGLINTISDLRNRPNIDRASLCDVIVQTVASLIGMLSEPLSTLMIADSILSQWNVSPVKVAMMVPPSIWTLPMDLVLCDYKRALKTISTETFVGGTKRIAGESADILVPIFAANGITLPKRKTAHDEVVVDHSTIFASGLCGMKTLFPRPQYDDVISAIVDNPIIPIETFYPLACAALREVIKLVDKTPIDIIKGIMSDKDVGIIGCAEAFIQLELSSHTPPSCDIFRKFKNYLTSIDPTKWKEPLGKEFLVWLSQQF